MWKGNMIMLFIAEFIGIIKIAWVTLLAKKKIYIQGITVEILWTYVRLYQLMEELVTCKWLNLMWRTENEPWRSEFKKRGIV